jgi:hypothetical protein
VVQAAYNSEARESATGCLPGTRAAILQEIREWVDSGATPIFWLNGMAGTGKSSIAHTIALEYDRRKSLGASFFFSRYQQERRVTKYLFQTIAFHLGCAYPTLKVEIAKVLEDRRVLTSNSRSQLQNLILDPISNVRDSFITPIVVVLDALDECEEGADVSRVVELIFGELRARALPLKFLVTSRPEPFITSVFRSPEVTQEIHPFDLQNVHESCIQEDIRTFVQHELSRIAARCREVLGPDPWPEEHEVEALVHLSAGLFIAAATALKYTAPERGSRNPRTRLATILGSVSHTHSGVFRSLDGMHSEILELAMGGRPPPDVVEQFQRVVGTVVLAYGHLTVHELAGLLQMTDEVTTTLLELRSVVLVPEGGGLVRTFHLSFHDYLTDKDRCTNRRFFIDPALRHTEIARYCLERMMRSLKRDICDICDPTKMNVEVDDLDQRITKYVPGDLQYACRYWAFHLSEGSLDESLLELVQSFVPRYTLYWIEILSLLGELARGIKAVKMAAVKLSVSFSP